MKLVTVGKDRGAALENVALEYIKKIQRYCPFEEVQLRPNPKNSRCACNSSPRLLILHVQRRKSQIHRMLLLSAQE